MTARANNPIDATITIVTTVDSFACAIQLLGENGHDLNGVGSVHWYLSKNSDGSTVAATSTDVTSLAAGTDGLVIETSSNVCGVAVSESDGDIDFTIVVPTGKTVYLVLVMPDGRLIISNIMTYTA